MKLLAGSFLILVFLDGFYSAPLINYDEENGHYRERHSSKRYGTTFGVGLNLGFEAGFKEGVASIQSKNNLNFDVGHYDDESSKEIEYPIYRRPEPFDFGSSFNNPNPYYSTYGYPYYPSQYPSQYWQQYGPQYPPRYDPQNALEHKTPPPNGTAEKPSNGSQSTNEEDIQEGMNH